MRKRPASLLILLFLPSLILLPCSKVSAQVESVKTYASIAVQPEHIMEGQSVEVAVKFFPPPPTPDEALENLSVLFGNPLQGISGHYSFVKNVSYVDADGYHFSSGPLTDSGYWSVQAFFSGQYFANNTIYYQPGNWYVMIYVTKPAASSTSSSSAPDSTVSPSPSPNASSAPSPSPSPSPEPSSTAIAETIGEQESFPTLLVAVASGTSIAIVGLGMLFFFKKRKTSN